MNIFLKLQRYLKALEVESDLESNHSLYDSIRGILKSLFGPTVKLEFEDHIIVEDNFYRFRSGFSAEESLKILLLCSLKDVFRIELNDEREIVLKTGFVEEQEESNPYMYSE